MDGRGPRAATMPAVDAVAAVPPPHPPSTTVLLQHPLHEEEMWQMSMRGSETMEAGMFPERPGELDCAYYLRTGLCRFGMTCRFNHPPNRELAIAAARIKGGYPERFGQPDCQYYLKTGTCKFGATCKFHHPREKVGIAGRVQLNILGYPLCMNEKECAYYLKTGACKFGNTCKFHHPQPSSTTFLEHGSPAYPAVQPPTATQQSYSGSLPSWPLSSGSFIASPRWRAPSSYAQLVLPRGLVQVPSWHSFPVHLDSVSTYENQPQIPGTNYYETYHQNETSVGVQGAISSYQSSTFPVGQLQQGNAFPERPGELECQFYMKTGDCKFGAVCKFHHPRERLIPAPNCLPSPLGLPLRPGEPLCVFYSRYGICKFGPSCKFDHPMATSMGVYAYSPSTSSSTVPVVRRLLSSSSTPPALTLSETPLEVVTGKARRVPISKNHQIFPGDENIQSE